MVRFTNGLGRVTVTNRGASFGETTVGEQTNLVLIGEAKVRTEQQRADESGPYQDSNATGTPNTLYDETYLGAPRNAASEAGRILGEGSRLTVNLTEALAQDQVPATIRAIAVPTETVENEVPANNGGVLQHYPIIEDKDRISLTDNGEDVPFEFVYDHDPVAPDETAAHTAVINPKRGETAGIPETAEISYPWSNYPSTFQSDAFLRSVDRNETATVMVLEDAESTALSFVEGLKDLRDEAGGTVGDDYRAALGYMGAEPNATSDTGRPLIDATSDSDTAYTHQINYDGLGLYGNVRLKWAPDSKGQWRTCLGGLAGKIAGNQLSDPVQFDDLQGYGQLEQRLRSSERQYLAEENVMTPINVRQRGEDGFGRPRSNQIVRVIGNTMASDATDYRRSQQVARVRDAWTLVVHERATSLLGKLTVQQFLERVATDLKEEWRDFVRRGVMNETTAPVRAGGNATGEQNTDPTVAGQQEADEAFFVRLESTQDGRIDLGTGFSPTPVIGYVTATNYIGQPGTVVDAGQGTTLPTTN